jgi:hypothetical protein
MTSTSDLINMETSNMAPMDFETRQTLQKSMLQSLREAARVAYVLDYDDTMFGEKAKAIYKDSNTGALVPTGQIIVPERARGKHGVTRMWCPYHRTWTDKIERDRTTGELIHGGRKGCGKPLTMPDDLGRLPVEDAKEDGGKPL